jgi:hypothetical protein
MSKEEAVPQSCILEVQIELSIVLYIRSLLLVESFDLRRSNQHILVRVIPSCFPFCENMFVPDKSPVKMYPEILDIFSGELHVVYMDRGTFSMCGECDVDRLGSVSFHSPFFKTNFGLQVSWFTVSVKQWLGLCPWLLLQYRRQKLLW